LEVTGASFLTAKTGEAIRSNRQLRRYCVEFIRSAPTGLRIVPRLILLA
jgi:hypothetical protein